MSTLQEQGLRFVEFTDKYTNEKLWHLEKIPSKSESLFSLLKKINDHEKFIKKKNEEMEALYKKKSTHKGRLALKNIQKAKNAKNANKKRLEQQKL